MSNANFTCPDVLPALWTNNFLKYSPRPLATSKPGAATSDPITVDSVSTSEAEPKIDVRRSKRRKRTISAYRDGETIVVMVPARLSKVDERREVATMVNRLVRSERRRHPSDADLDKRASALSDRYLDSLSTASSVRWVTNQNTRWGSCTPANGSIRLSTRLQGMPAYVIDYVLLHELAHLLVHGHGEDFWSYVHRYAMSERARGFLEGISAAASFDVPAKQG